MAHLKEPPLPRYDQERRYRHAGLQPIYSQKTVRFVPGFLVSGAVGAGAAGDVACLADPDAGLVACHQFLIRDHNMLQNRLSFGILTESKADFLWDK